ncbi:hypothetical protein FOA52_015023 [Chlamydomonas sp. UWO 241]|nr:hypothetical protein FOA52_015023 [Chlamydomonas sp. UWO 241]
MVIGLVQSGLEGLPFGAPLGALLSCVYGRAAKAAINTEAAEALLRHIKVVHRHLHGFAQGGKSGTADLERLCQRLVRLLALAAKFLHAYSGRGFLKRMLLSNTDEAKFALLTARVKEEMLTIAFVAVAEWGPRPQDSQLAPLPDAKALRTALAKLAGRSDGEMMSEAGLDKCLEDVALDKPEELRALLRGARMEDRIIDAALGEIRKRVRMLEVEIVVIRGTVDALRATVAQILKVNKANADLPPASLLPALSVWWSKNVGKHKKSVNAHTFASKLASWMRENGHEARLVECETELSDRGFQFNTSGSVPGFLDPVLVWLLDADCDGQITRTELVSVQIKAARFADEGLLADDEGKRIAPGDWPTLLDALLLGLDGVGELAGIKAGRGPSNCAAGSNDSVADGLMQQLEKLMKVKAVIQSYQITSLLEDYVKGTRIWLYDYAGKAMVLVKHFFKVGKERSQKSAMIRSLACQLAEKLPGFAELLLPVAEKHGNGAALSMDDAFTSFMLGPLHELEHESRNPLSTVVMLLDALDEATDGTRDWPSVAHLIAHKFVKLPACIRIILTSRPQVQVASHEWAPHIIEPLAMSNLDDMSKLLHAKLVASGRVRPGDEAGATRVLLEKSEGQFIYAKYALDYLSLRERWTVEELEQGLPHGLGGAYYLTMATLTSALGRGGTEGQQLLELLTGRLLPVLVAAREPMRVDQLAWACGSDVTAGRVDNKLLAQGHPGTLFSVAFSPDGAMLATGCMDKMARIWDVSSGQCVSTLQGHTGVVKSVAFSPDGHTLATGSDDKNARVWDVSSGQCVSTVQGGTMVQC